MIKAALITISTSRAEEADASDPDAARAAGFDVSGERLLALAESFGAEVVGRGLIADDHERIVETLVHWSGRGEANLILTTGGTGFAPADRTPEATREVIERPTPGISEALRRAAAAHTENWPLSRGEAGIRGRCLIVNLPGSPRSIDQSGPVLKPFLDHAISLIEDNDCGH